MKNERRTTTVPAVLEVREDKSQKITGYGAVFYDGTAATEYEIYPGMKERIMPGAFDRALSEKQDVRGLFNHNADLVLGRTSADTMRLSIDAKGLKYDIDPAETSISRDVQEHVRRRDVKGSSFSFSVTEQRWTETKIGDDQITIREIVDVDLFDVGPVTFPAYESTESELRSLAHAARPKTGLHIETIRRQLALAELE